MKLTKQRKIYLGVLALGLVALAWDRFSGGAKETVEAPPEVLKSAATTRPSSKAATRPSLTQRLTETVDPAAPERDIFKATAAWGGATATARGEPQSDVMRFKKVHRLTATLVAGRGSRAIIDGKALKMGEMLDGFKLVSVTQNRAALESGSATVVLTLDAAISRTDP